MSQIIGVIDEPVAPGSTDNLDIKIHSKSLIDFVQQTNTPITVGIQGEWGSGKTSLLNSIYHAYTSESTFKQIWINSWEYSLLSTPEEALLKIINKIIDELLDSDVDVKRRDTIRDGAKKIFRGALRIGAQVALGDDAAKVTDELMGSSKQSITSLREHLKNLVSDIAQRPTNPYKKIIIYVDDLDRIEPKNAVAILELLKNIFSVPNCVFILAIDYQVVVKGLEHKYGKQTHENEWEFRAFFDKIIQLPFMMPMGQYNIGKYVNALLVEIGFVEGDGLEDEAIREIILRTIGGNPRSIKRLVNSVSLIQIFVNNKKELSKEEVDEDQKEEGISDRDEKFLLFSLLCLQIAFPPIYSLLVQEPDFTKWDDALAFSTTKRSEERDEAFQGEFENAQKTDDFDEEWEKVLYRICYERPRLKPRVADISKFFSYIKDDLLSENQEIIGETLARILSQTSVTSVTSTDQNQNIVDITKPVAEKSEFRHIIKILLKFIEDSYSGWSQNLNAEKTRDFKIYQNLLGTHNTIYMDWEAKNGEKIYFEVGLTAHRDNCEKALFGEKISVDNYEAKNYVYFRINSRNNAPVIKEFIESNLSKNSNFSEYINGSKNKKPHYVKFIEFEEITFENIEKVITDEMENAKSFLEQIFLSVE